MRFAVNGRTIGDGNLGPVAEHLAELYSTLNSTSGTPAV